MRSSSFKSRKYVCSNSDSIRSIGLKPCDLPLVSTLEILEDRKLLSSAIYTVTTTADSGPGSLRDAITQANANSGQSTINFSIAAGGVQSINLLSALPTLSNMVILDGTTEGGYAGTPLIQLNGSALGAGVDGLDVTGGNSTINGLAIDGFSGAGINLSVLGGDTLQSNYIGVSPSGSTTQGNGEGVVVLSGGNYIGTPGEGNLISGNSINGLRISGTAGSPVAGNVISSNQIGTDSNGSIALGNSEGINLNYIASMTITGNLISGNANDGILLSNSLNATTVIQANQIGVDESGTRALGNGGNGINVENSSYVLIGGVGGNRNILSSNTDGVLLVGSSNITVAGNYIGTDGSGSTLTDVAGNSFGNSGNGVDVQAGSHDNTIGGTSAAAGNVIASYFGNDVEISTGATASDLVEFNDLGTDVNGTLSLSGYGDGVYVASAGSTVSNNVIGSSTDGLYLLAATTVQGNSIGLGADGVTAIPNSADGIYLAGSGSIIGGVAAGQGNIIADNTGNGVDVASGTQNSIRGNSIYGNGGLGIDLGANGVTPNGTAPRTGANNLQNHPVLTTATLAGAGVTVSGSLTGSLPSTTYTVDFYGNLAADPSGSGQGRAFLGSVTVTTDSSIDPVTGLPTGSGSFTATLPTLPAADVFITSTATDPVGNTSEFSGAVQVSVGAQQAITRTTLSTSNANAVVGQSVTFTAGVTAGPGPLSGNVTFQEVVSSGNVTLGPPVKAVNGVAKLTISTLPVGTYQIIAVYGNDPNFSGSTSTPITQNVASNKVSITGTTYRDVTGDGLSADDTGLSGVTVRLYRGGTATGTPVATMVSDSNGNYSFGNLTAGQYTIAEVTPTGYVRTAPALSSSYTINTVAGSTYTHEDFDNYMTCNDRQYVSCISYSVNGGCWIPDMSGKLHEGDTVRVRFNVACGHTATLSLVSYTTPDNTFQASDAYEQQVYQYATGTFAAGCHTMTVTVPKCDFQVDFVCGDYIDHFGPASSNVFYSAQNRLIDSDNGGLHSQLLSLLGAQNESMLNT